MDAAEAPHRSAASSEEILAVVRELHLVYRSSRGSQLAKRQAQPQRSPLLPRYWRGSLHRLLGGRTPESHGSPFARERAPGLAGRDPRIHGLPPDLASPDFHPLLHPLSNPP